MLFKKRQKQKDAAASTATGQPDIKGADLADGDQISPMDGASAARHHNDTGDEANSTAERPRKGSRGSRFAYLKTKQFWIVLLLGQILALCITGTNTLTSLLVEEGTSIPAFQTLFNYILLNLVFTSYTLWKYGIKKWFRLLWKDGWKYIILSFFDVEGNYFTVLAYRYTTIMSAQLINFWAIVVVVAVSFTFLKVRYRWAQIIGILICIGGMGVLLGSDHITGQTDFGGVSSGDQLKGDLFAVAGATFYGLANVSEEFLVSKRPLYEVVGQLGFWAMMINGVQAAIFDRPAFQDATWSPKVGGLIAGFTLILSLFYTLVPLLYRLASAAFFNISLLTANFWGVIVGVELFAYSVHFLYPIAFVLIILGQVVYFCFAGRSNKDDDTAGPAANLGDAYKAWLGRGQEKGIAGLGTAKRMMKKGNTSTTSYRSNYGEEEEEVEDHAFASPSSPHNQSGAAARERDDSTTIYTDPGRTNGMV